MARHAGRTPATPRVLNDPLRNRGVGFTQADRDELGLTGRLPSAVLTLEQQAQRAYQQLQAQGSDLAKNVYLEQLHDRNETLYYKVLTDHLGELLPVVYDPTVGEAIEKYSHEYRNPRGLFLSIDRAEDVEKAFATVHLGPEDVDLVVCSDAEQILGIGDWGVGGIQIAVGKLAVYSAAAGIDPARTLPVSLDVGTDREELLKDPLYLGNRHPRVRGADYDAFIETYLRTVSAMFPRALLHFEDFGPSNARRILETYGGYRIFNDDMQGTGAIVLAAVLSAIKVSGAPMREQKVVVFGAGTAGVGIADQLRDAMAGDGGSREQATSQVWLIDKPGLLTRDTPDLRDFQQSYARDPAEVADWTRDDGAISLLETVKQVKPTILVGTSAVHGAFTREVVEAMARGAERPIILPLSNPTSRIEAMPADIIAWTKGKALVATGIPVPPVEHDGVTYRIAQANNALLYPGLGLGTIVSGASKVTDRMLSAAARAVADQVDIGARGASLLPPVDDLRESSAITAASVVEAAVSDGVATGKPSDPGQAVRQAMWEPVYGNGATA
ncbi:NAD-dependent malic enzyme [Actinomadura rupiterrae]|uniref:NAD-dependent malic enzyme n=1 Tax=Actinomadura rupiterrae TaxID=559627 RepID=UPI00264638A2|nr:NAD-dependent malic enzyme [Actinomadura rupiterrae]